MDVSGKYFAILGRKHSVIDQIGIFEGNRLVKMRLEMKVCGDQSNGRLSSPGTIHSMRLEQSSISIAGAGWIKNIAIIT